MVAEEGAMCGSSSANAAEASTDGKLQDPMELLDDCWFYSNLLLASRTRTMRRSSERPTSTPPVLSADDCSLDYVWSAVQKQQQRQGKVECSAPRTMPRADRVASGALLRAPSMPTPQVRREESGDQRIEDCSDSDVEEDDIVAMVKRSLMEDHRVRSAASTGRRTLLLRTPSMPVPRAAPPAIALLHEADAPSKKSIYRLRHSGSILESHILHHRSPSSVTRGGDAVSAASSRSPRDHPKLDDAGSPSGWAANEEAISKRAFLRAKMWNSFADLESAEVQGLKDLGFVFGQEELNSRLLRVSPSMPRALNRPHLSEAWFVQRSAPPVVLKRASRSSAVDMKEQLRFWARAVACNVRHEC